MQTLHNDSLRYLKKECKLAYTNKKIEIIKIFEIRDNSENIIIEKEISIPEKATVAKTGGISISTKYLNYLCLDFNRRNKGILIIHNHDKHSIPSPSDNYSFEAIKKIIDYYNVYPCVFAIYSKVDIYFRIVFNINFELELTINQNDIF